MFYELNEDASPVILAFTMRRILQFGILAALGAIFSVASSQASVLWWETNDPADIVVAVTDEQGQPTGETTTAADLGVTDVRIRVSGGDAGMKRIPGTLPLKRPVSPADVADAVILLASSRSVTGSVLAVDCGQSLLQQP